MMVQTVKIGHWFIPFRLTSYYSETFLAACGHSGAERGDSKFRVPSRPDNPNKPISLGQLASAKTGFR